MKNVLVLVSLFIITINVFASNGETYDRKRIKYFIDHTGTTDEPLIQIQALGGSMAAYNTLLNVDKVLELNNFIIKQNEEIIKLLKKDK